MGVNTRAKSTKNLQVRLATQAYDTLKHIADVRGKSVSDVFREALEIYSIGVVYAAQGKQLFWEDRQTGGKTEVLIPGFTAPAAGLVASQFASSTEH